MSFRHALVTGANRGLGLEFVRQLLAAGSHVVATCRHPGRATALNTLAGEHPGRLHVLPLDVATPKSQDELARELPLVLGEDGRLDLLVNNAGGAKGLEPVTDADLDDWRWMYETNVLGTVAVTKALAPALIASGAGTIINVGSTAGRVTYEGGGGYTAAKHAQTAVAGTLRLELCGRPVRVIEIDPGMVKTEEFGLVRFGGDADRAEAVYAGVAEPLVADDVADCVAWCATRPHHVNIDRLVVRPLAQAAQHKVHRES